MSDVTGGALNVYFGHPLDGYSKLDPPGRLAIDTEYINGGTDIVLTDKENTNEILRIKDSFGRMVHPNPVWTSGGDRVAFILWEKNVGYPKIYSLSRDVEELKELTPHPIRKPPYSIRYLFWSPDGNYIHFTIWRRGIAEGPGYIMNTNTIETKEICSPDTDHFYYGDWVPESDILVYEVNSEESAELGLLDVSDWKMQTISSVGLQMVDTEFVEENNDGISYSHLAFRIWVIGWTPLEDIIQN